MLNKFTKNKIRVLILLGIFLIIPFNKIKAATLSFSPSSSNVSVDNVATVRVVVNTLGKSINNAEGVISFPKDSIEVVSISKTSSIFSLWVEEPSFSNTTGRISFNGGITNPGFNGTSGTVLSIVFRGKKQGTAPLVFSSGAVRENDGLGTNILNSLNNGIIQIVTDNNEKAVSFSEENKTVPIKPVIISSTHPDQNLWYSKNTASFNWKIPKDVTSIQTLFDNKSSSVPKINYDSSITQRTLSDISDGEFYFHLRYVNSTGWGPTTHYKVKIDVTPPQLSIPVVGIKDNRNVILLEAGDSKSGINHYTLKIDDKLIINIFEEELIDGTYILPVLNEGSHKIEVIVYDNAENFSSSIVDFLSPKILPPKINLSQEEITKGDSVTILGQTDYPDSQIEIVLKTKGKEIRKYTQKILSDGSFSIETDQIKNTGIIDISGRVIFPNDIKSDFSEKIYLKVGQPRVLEITLAIAYPVLSLTIVALALIIFILVLYLGWHRFFGLKNKIKKDLKDTTTNTHRALLLLKEELNYQLNELEEFRKDRSLNEKEEAIFKEIKDNIDKIDNFIENRIKGVL